MPLTGPIGGIPTIRTGIFDYAKPSEPVRSRFNILEYELRGGYKQGSVHTEYQYVFTGTEMKLIPFITHIPLDDMVIVEGDTFYVRVNPDNHEDCGIEEEYVNVHLSMSHDKDDLTYATAKIIVDPEVEFNSIIVNKFDPNASLF